MDVTGVGLEKGSVQKCVCVFLGGGGGCEKGEIISSEESEW